MEKNESGLVKFDVYDSALLVTIADIQELFQERGLCSNTEELFVRASIRLFAIQPQGQFKPTATRGKGDYLYLRSEVMHMLDVVMSARAINS